MSGGASKDEALEYFVFRQIFDDSADERDDDLLKLDERDKQNGFSAERNTAPTMPLTRARTRYNRF